MDFGFLPPEINSGRMYAGPGAGPMLAAASAWDGLAAELQSTAATYSSTISDLTGEAWVGPSSAAMAAAVTPYMTWMNATAELAAHTAIHAKAAAAAYASAFAMTVPPPVIAANRALLAALVATNFLGINTPAIMATEAHYMEMWAQDAVAMYTYAGDSAAASALTPFTSPAPTANPAGTAGQAAAVAHAAGTSAGSSQSTIAQLISTLLNGLGSPGSSPTAGSGLSSLLGNTAASTGTGLVTSPFGTIDTGSITSTLISEYAYLPGFFGLFTASNAIGPLMATPINMALMSAGAAGAAAAPAAAAAAVPGLLGASGAAAGAGGMFASGLGSGLGGLGAGLGGVAGMGGAASIGALSVPPSWALAAATPLEMLAPTAAPLAMSAGEFGAAGMIGAPMFFGGLPAGAMVGAAGLGAVGSAGSGGVAAKYTPHLNVVSRPAAAGYPAEQTEQPIAKYKYPAVDGYSLNGNTPPGYRAAIVYLPIIAPEQATV